MISKFIEYLKEILNTKSYKWIKSKYIFRKTAYFKTKTNKNYYLFIDEIMSNVYNIHFYYEKIDGTKEIKLINDGSGDVFEILGNIKNAVAEFIDDNEYIEFIGFSSFEDERHDLYCMFLKHISSKKFTSYWKEIGKITYYFVSSRDTTDLITKKYEEEFIKYDKKNKML
jgi:hypothetical protein